MDELIQQLQDLTGRIVSRSTVWRALGKLGFTRKKVFFNLLNLSMVYFFSLDAYRPVKRLWSGAKKLAAGS